MDAIERFADLVAGADPELDRGALAIAAGADHDLDESRWLTALDRLATGVDSLDGLRQRLFAEAGFTGDTRRYYDPRNSLLPDVLVRRKGIPITLSVVCLEVGRRAGVALEGIGMPGHFLVRPVGGSAYLDPFGGGTMLDAAGCEELFRSSTGAPRTMPFGPELMAPTTSRQILVRMLANLRAIYRARASHPDREWVLRMRMALPGWGAEELLELGEAIGAQGRFIDAARLLEAAAEGRPGDAEAFGHAAKGLRARLN